MGKMIIDQEYSKLFLDLKTRVTASRYRAAVKVNNELINLYHHIGNIILQSQEKKGWGAKIINQLSMDLRAEFPDMKGFSPQNLKYMRKFAEEFSQTEIGQQAVDQIPWGHIVLLMYSGLDKEQINFYVNQTVENGWSRNVLSVQIETKLHKKKGAAVTNFDKKLPLPQSDLAQSTLKNPYLFDFLSLGDRVSSYKNSSKNLANNGPSPNTKIPLDGYEDLVFLKNIISFPNIQAGDYTYYDDRRYGAKNFEENNVLYNYQPDRVKLVFGKFCAIAAETKFIMTGDHKLDAISTYPFPIFKNGWESLYDVHQLPIKGDIIVKNDVWFGYNSMVRNGVTIGNGAIIGANAFVVKDVPDYAIVVGNPAKIVKMRFDEKNIARLLEIAWWDWDIEKINAKLPAICSLDIEALGDD